MKIRHVLPGNNLVATYILKEAPYFKVRQCVQTGLVTRTITVDGESKVVDEIIGFVLDGTIRAADELHRTGEKFMGYQNPLMFPKEAGTVYGETWEEHLRKLMAWGQEWERNSRPAPTPPDHIRQIWESEEVVGQG